MLPPSGPTYSTLARFDETDEQWLEEAWSLVIDFHTPPDKTWTHLVSVYFLSSDGPADGLVPNRLFALYQGYRKVAEGVVLADSEISNNINGTAH